MGASCDMGTRIREGRGEKEVSGIVGGWSADGGYGGAVIWCRRYGKSEPVRGEETGRGNCGLDKKNSVAI